MTIRAYFAFKAQPRIKPDLKKLQRQLLWGDASAEYFSYSKGYNLLEDFNFIPLPGVVVKCIKRDANYGICSGEQDLATTKGGKIYEITEGTIQNRILRDVNKRFQMMQFETFSSISQGWAYISDRPNEHHALKCGFQSSEKRRVSRAIMDVPSTRAEYLQSIGVMPNKEKSNKNWVFHNKFGNQYFY